MLDIFLRDNGFFSKEKIHVHPKIPMQKKLNALSSYCAGLDSNEVIILIDDTLFGGAKEGVIITNEKIIAKEMFEDPREVYFDHITHIHSEKGKIFINEQKFVSLSMPDAPDLYILCILLQKYIQTAISETPQQKLGIPSLLNSPYKSN